MKLPCDVTLEGVETIRQGSPLSTLIRALEDLASGKTELPIRPAPRGPTTVKAAERKRIFVKRAHN